MILPFGLLLAMIALAPLFFSTWWGKHYIKIAVGLAAVMVLYYFFGLGAKGRIVETAHNYISFIVFIGALFVVSGGIHIRVKGEATPMANVMFLATGAFAANLLGTTGASMLLIRPWIRMNRHRITGYHVVFFIFIISNVGGCLTPVGDPPLFIGYLMGVPFWWVTKQCWPMWLTGAGVLLAMFYVLDLRNYKQASKNVRDHLTAHEEWRFDGLHNLIFLAVIFGAVFIERIPFLREALMLGAAFASYHFTHDTVHESNEFTFHPVKEVAVLFLGIFATMMPALDWLQANARLFGSPTPTLMYFGSGALSSVLDNAPTYWSFLSASIATLVNPDTVTSVKSIIAAGGAHAVAGTDVSQTLAVLQQYHPIELAANNLTTEHIQVANLLGNPSSKLYVIAVTIGSVFFGANTYIGNGPNFMVKAIADQQKVTTPDFLTYIFKYTLPFMAPMLLLVWWLFFSH